jgi:hypothetical protein
MILSPYPKQNAQTARISEVRFTGQPEKVGFLPRIVRGGSFHPVKRPPIPSSMHEHPVDAFLFGTKAAPPSAADLMVLRRSHLDLPGLAPALAEQE